MRGQSLKGGKHVTDVITSTALQAAREHDAAGRHSDAINTLSSACRAGDFQAMSELGHRLLVGDRAPRLIPHALSFITEAARGGDGRALARVAALTAAGAHMPQDWSKSIRLLGDAAAAGDAAARGQLQCLQQSVEEGEEALNRRAAERRLAEEAGTRGQPPHLQPATEAESADANIDWRALASSVNLEYWLSAASVESLHAKVHRVPNLVPVPVCAWLIARAQGHLSPATVYDAVIKKDLVHEMRTNTLANFDYATLDVVQFLVQARMAHACGYRLQHFEAPMVLHYEVGQQITPHFDFIDVNAPDYAQQIREQGQRMITFLLYLNDDYVGGETTFPKLALVNRGVRGDGFYFINAHDDRSPDRDMLHTGSPPTSGEKWIVSQFIRDIPLRP
jgi:prolyl 4-hydroxylase